MSIISAPMSVHFFIPVGTGKYRANIITQNARMAMDRLLWVVIPQLPLLADFCLMTDESQRAPQHYPFPSS
jgi:hypothetical protein